jgi:hypothetical protein
MTAHARLGPSGAEQWMTCPGSVRLIERLERDGTISRDRGSSFAAHDLRSICLGVLVRADVEPGALPASEPGQKDLVAIYQIIAEAPPTRTCWWPSGTRGQVRTR